MITQQKTTSNHHESEKRQFRISKLYNILYILICRRKLSVEYDKFILKMSLEMGVTKRLMKEYIDILIASERVYIVEIDKVKLIKIKNKQRDLDEVFRWDCIWL